MAVQFGSDGALAEADDQTLVQSDPFGIGLKKEEAGERCLLGPDPFGFERRPQTEEVLEKCQRNAFYFRDPKEELGFYRWSPCSGRSINLVNKCAALSPCRVMGWKLSVLWHPTSCFAISCFCEF
uniref:SPARC_Ca_bdg domain-containing protein n=1 Tax=Steinernema glaseri TaxID=37863 RepID=A0A1I7Y1V4_9BILA